MDFDDPGKEKHPYQRLKSIPKFLPHFVLAGSNGRIKNLGSNGFAFKITGNIRQIKLFIMLKETGFPVEKKNLVISACWSH